MLGALLLTTALFWSKGNTEELKARVSDFLIVPLYVVITLSIGWHWLQSTAEAAGISTPVG